MYPVHLKIDTIVIKSKTEFICFTLKRHSLDSAFGV